MARILSMHSRGHGACVICLGAWAGMYAEKASPSTLRSHCSELMTSGTINLVTIKIDVSSQRGGLCSSQSKTSMSSPVANILTSPAHALIE